MIRFFPSTAIGVLLFLGGLPCPILPAEEIEATWLRVPPEFMVTRFADDSLASNIYSMTTDRLGRIVVAGPGYIRILIDEDGDGRAESATLFSKRPKNGAQGLCFDGTDLLCIGDEGLLRFRDNDRDDRADGPPEVLIRFKTGGEHDSHAIRKGPDGWWYLVSGNYSGVGKSLINSGRSPIKAPVAGVITRISPDFRLREIVADGMRNTYDFDFDSRGSLMVYDSDGERDVSLPWYQPTRVYRLHPGANAGWVSRNWKRPDYFFDMPQVAARLGRGSPTGVVCYRHFQFPEKYQDATFVLDWTFGRVIAVQPTATPDGIRFQHQEFMTGKGTHGFAPTDVCVGVDGSLYISVGGRSTQGSVYRIRHRENSRSVTRIRKPKTLADCLDLPQPQSAWSRFLAEPFAQKAGQESLEKAVLNTSLPIRHRVRAVELLVSQFGQIRPSILERSEEIHDADVQGALAWAVCRQPISQIKASVLFHFLNHPRADVRRRAVEALTGSQSIPSYLAEPILKCLQSKNRDLQKATAAFVSASWFNPLDYIDAADRPEKPPTAYWFGRLARKSGLYRPALEAALNQIQTANGDDALLDGLRLFQLALGDFGPRQGIPQVFESYHGSIPFPSDLVKSTRGLLAEKLAMAKPDQPVQREILRCLAMAKLVDEKLAESILLLIDPDSDPVFDIHVLASIAESSFADDAPRHRIAQGILGLQPKIDARHLNQDRNWQPRVKEIIRKLVQLDPGLAGEIAQQDFTRIGQIFLFDFVPAEKRVDSIDRFMKNLRKDEDFQLTSDLVRLLGSTPHPPHWKIIRDSFETDPQVRDTVVELLGRKPYEGDREKFIGGLKSSQTKIVRIAAQALWKLSPSQKPAEQFALLDAMERIGTDNEGYAAREWVARVLERNMGQNVGFIYGTGGYHAQSNAIAEWHRILEQKFPEDAKQHKSRSKFDLAAFQKRLFEVNWESGDLKRGKKLYGTLTCIKCHGQRNRLGPDLAGVTRRFSREDLFRAIADPSFQVPSRYQMTLFETESGQFVSGIVIYDSVDGVLIRDAENRTIRIEQSEILNRQIQKKSLMPENLLDEVDNQGLADLYRYLQSL